MEEEKNIDNAQCQQNTGLTWVPSLYFAEGLPYVMVTMVAVVMLKNFGLSLTDIALYTSWLYLPWVIKPVWSPVVEMTGTKKGWIIAMQATTGVGFALIAFTLGAEYWLEVTMAVLWLVAFASATHDISADGYYIIIQDEKRQAQNIGVRNIFYRVAMITGQGGVVAMAGWMFGKRQDWAEAWAIVMACLAVLMIALALWHFFVLKNDNAVNDDKFSATKKINVRELKDIFTSYFRKDGILMTLAFILLYRLAEAQLGKIAAPFLLDERAKGGLGLTNGEVGLAYGTIGVVALLVGGLVGGLVVAKGGLRKWMIPMVLAMNVPDLVYVYFAVAQPESLLLINGGILLEQLGYGFGFTAFTLYLIKASEGKYATAHYAISTGLMALGMMLPGMIAGKIADSLSYTGFFVWVLLCTIPGILIGVRWKISKDSENNV